MCEPTTWLTIGSLVVGAFGQRQQAQAQEAALNEQNRAQAEELAASRDQAIGERVAAARREAARRLVAAGESGVGGPSAVADIMQTFGRANQDNAVTAKQAAFERRAQNAAYTSAYAQIDRPNYLDTGLQIAAAGYSGYKNWQDNKAKKFTIKKGT